MEKSNIIQKLRIVAAEMELLREIANEAYLEALFILYINDKDSDLYQKTKLEMR